WRPSLPWRIERMRSFPTPSRLRPTYGGLVIYGPGIPLLFLRPYAILVPHKPYSGLYYFKKMATAKAKHTAHAKAGNDAFAVIATGGKQYKVKVGDVVQIEKIVGEHKVGDKLSFGDVLLVDDAGTTSVGAPFIAGRTVGAEIKEI